MSARTVYRRLFRELARQHAAAAREQEAIDMKKILALKKYREQTGKTTSDLKLNPTNFTVLDYDSTQLRQAFKEHSDATYGLEVAEYLKSQRIYKELLQRYNDSLIEEDDRLKLSARRVGLDLPL